MVGRRLRAEPRLKMTEPSIEWVHLDPAAPDALQIGDVVSADAGGLPIYRIVALEDRQAWVRDEQHSALRLLSIQGLHWKIGGAGAVR